MRTTVASADIGTHLAKLFHLGLRLLARLLGELGLADALFELVQLVAALFAFAQFLLDRLQLLVQIVLALGLLHLALDAACGSCFSTCSTPISDFDQIEHAFSAVRPY